MRFPRLEALQTYHRNLAMMVARTSWFPNKTTVERLGGTAFPTLRRKAKSPIFSYMEEGEMAVAMFDDNVTPEWAIAWAHGLQGTRPKGWTIAHVWPTSEDRHSYTHLANLAMVPEAFGSLTDKKGPLTGFLQWHAWRTYGWKPEHKGVPEKPDCFDEVEWRYLPAVDDPKKMIREEFNRRNNERTRKLRPIMERLGML